MTVSLELIITLAVGSAAANDKWIIRMLHYVCTQSEFDTLYKGTANEVMWIGEDDLDTLCQQMVAAGVSTNPLTPEGEYTLAPSAPQHDLDIILDEIAEDGDLDIILDEITGLPIYVGGKQVLEMYVGGNRVTGMYVGGKSVL